MPKTKRRIRWLWLLIPLFMAVGLLLWHIHTADRPVPAHALAQKQVILTPVEADVSEGDLIPLINADHACGNPENLINLYAQKNRGFSLASSEIELTEVTFQAAKSMFLAAAEDGTEGFILSSGYRSYEKQAEEYEKDPVVAAKPGHSEHGSGLAFDVTAYGPSDFTKTQQFTWLYANCWDYGFILRYPSDKAEVTGIPAESWHYRYVGLPHSRIMGELGFCLEEYADYLSENGPLKAEYKAQSWIIGVDAAGNIRCVTVE